MTQESSCLLIPAQALAAFARAMRPVSCVHLLNDRGSDVPHHLPYLVEVALNAVFQPVQVARFNRIAQRHGNQLVCALHGADDFFFVVNHFYILSTSSRSRSMPR